MLVPQELLDCVAFLGYEKVTRDEIQATAFFVSVLSPGEMSYVYLATAAHCVANLDTGELYDGLFVRLNNPVTGTTIPAALPKVNPAAEGAIRWYFHPDYNPLRQREPDDLIVDLAVLPVDHPEQMLERGYQWTPVSMFFDEKDLSDEPNAGVGPGDEVVTIGLLTVHTGTLRNEPIIRTGNIAVFPNEPVVSKKSPPQELYLVEARSVGGLSGSPVSARHRHPLGQSQTPISLMGVLSSHWSDVAPKDPRMHDGGPLNMGIARVVPARLLHELLNQKELVAIRDRADMAASDADDGPATELR